MCLFSEKCGLINHKLLTKAFFDFQFQLLDPRHQPPAARCSNPSKYPWTLDRSSSWCWCRPWRRRQFLFKESTTILEGLKYTVWPTTLIEDLLMRDIPIALFVEMVFVHVRPPDAFQRLRVLSFSCPVTAIANLVFSPPNSFLCKCYICTESETPQEHLFWPY